MKYFNPRLLHIELSSKCTLKCPRCPRTELHPDNLQKEISLEQFRSAFSKDILQQVEKIIFCGDVGDPIYAKDLIDICAYIRSCGSTDLVIVTNGSYRSVEWWAELGHTLGPGDRVTFSVDGWDQHSNEQYRVNSNFESIVAGARSLRANSQCLMNWSAIYFRFNQDHMDQIQALARELGFDSFQTVRSTKFDGRYLVNGVDPLKPTQVSTSALFERDTVWIGRAWSNKNYNRNYHPWAKCVNWAKELFISVEGTVFPCAWFNSGYAANDFVVQHQDRMSIKTRSLDQVLADDVWQELVNNFDHRTLPICEIKCKNDLG